MVVSSRRAPEPRRVGKGEWGASEGAVEGVGHGPGARRPGAVQPPPAWRSVNSAHRAAASGAAGASPTVTSSLAGRGEADVPPSLGVPVEREPPRVVPASSPPGWRRRTRYAVCTQCDAALLSAGSAWTALPGPSRRCGPRSPYVIEAVPLPMALAAALVLCAACACCASCACALLSLSCLPWLAVPSLRPDPARIGGAVIAARRNLALALPGDPDHAPVRIPVDAGGIGQLHLRQQSSDLDRPRSSSRARLCLVVRHRLCRTRSVLPSGDHAGVPCEHSRHWSWVSCVRSLCRPRP